MPIARFEMPDGRIARFEVPDGTTPEQAHALISQQVGGQPQQAEGPQKIGAEAFPDTMRDVLSGADGVTKAAAAFGSGVRGMYEGARQMFGADNTANIQGNKAIAEASPFSAFLGNVAPAVVSAAIPGANTYTGAAAISGLTGLLQPTQGDESRTLNTFTGLGAGLAGQYGAGKIGDIVRGRAAAASAKAAAENAAKEPLRITLKNGQDLGMVVPPASVNPSPTNKTLEALSGKYATANEAAIRNQKVVNDTVRKALDLPEGTPLTEATLKAYRDAKGVPYNEVAKIGDVPVMGYNPGSLGPSVKGGSAPGFMNMQNKPIPGAGTINTGEAVERLKELRFASKEQWSFYKRSGDPEARAKAESIGTAAENLENWLEKAAAYSGKPDLIRELRAARVAIAKSHDVERALTDATGNVSARDLAKSKYLTGELKKVAQFADAFPAATKSPEAIGSPVTLVDAGASALLGMTGAAASGGPAGALAAAGWPLARMGARAALLSRPYQSTLAQVQQSSVPKSLSLADLLLQSRLAQGMVPNLAAQGVLGAIPVLK